MNEVIRYAMHLVLKDMWGDFFTIERADALILKHFGI